MIRYAVAAMLFFAPHSAEASEWWWINFTGVKPDRSVIFIDKDSIRVATGGRTQAWEFLYYETPFGNPPIRNAKVLNEYNCAEQSVTEISAITYSVSGGVADSYVIDRIKRKVQPIAPDTIGSAALSFVCGDESQGTRANFADVSSVATSLLEALDAKGK